MLICRIIINLAAIISALISVNVGLSAWGCAVEISNVVKYLSLVSGVIMLLIIALGYMVHGKFGCCMYPCNGDTFSTPTK